MLSMAEPKTPSPYTYQLALKMTEPMERALKAVAAEEDRSPSAVVRVALRHYLDEHAPGWDD